MASLLASLDWVAYLTGLLGAPLSWIEYFHPRMADRIENTIDKGQDRFEEWGDKFTRNHLFDILLVPIILLFFFLIYIPISRYSDLVDPIFLPWYAWAIIAVMYTPIVLGLLSYLVAWLIDVCNKATNGHALGTLGLALIILGIACDSLDKLLSI